MLIGCKVPDLNGIAGPFAVHQGAPRKRLTERTGEHLRVESEDLSSKSHQLSMTLLHPLCNMSGVRLDQAREKGNASIPRMQRQRSPDHPIQAQPRAELAPSSACRWDARFQICPLLTNFPRRRMTHIPPPP